MNFPGKCPKCNSVFGQPMKYVDGRPVEVAYLIIRTELDFDSDDDSRIEDQIYECSHCHTLFRARWELISFTWLEEKKFA